MTIFRYMPAIAISAILAGSAALAQTAFAQTAEPPAAAQETPNQAIERQIEARTGDGTSDGAPDTERNTLGEAAATAQSAPVIGSGAALEWVGKPIAAIDGTTVGTVTEVVVDQNGAVTEVHAKVGGLFGLFAQEVSIPAASILLERDGTLVAEMSAEQIKTARKIRG